MVIKESFLNELSSKQLKNIPLAKKLSFSDLKRIDKYIINSIFDVKDCCIWQGYITNVNNPNKALYINFYFKKKKIALHRLLYINFKESLENYHYIKFLCENKGKCCNVNHMNKCEYKINNIDMIDDEEDNEVDDKEDIEDKDKEDKSKNSKDIDTSNQINFIIDFN